MRLSSHRVRLFPDPILLKRCKALATLRFPEFSLDYLSFAHVESLEFSEVLDDMTRLMRDKQGVGLAAPQVGVPFRFFITDPGFGTPDFVANPEILDQNEHRIVRTEGCLSLPGVKVDVTRPSWIRCRWQDRQGAFIEASFEDFAARLFLHEADHLDGILIGNPEPEIL